MHECCYSCLVFLFSGKCGKFSNLHAPPATPGLQHDYKAVTTML